VQNAVNAGAIGLVAAGNDNSDASGFTPANSPAAITVAALGYNFGGTPARASYSNYGNAVEIAAPGGEQREDSDGDGYGDGVLSTIADFVAFYQGTSMATPHVAGVAMLMKAQNPDLSQAEALTILQATADTDIDCNAGCGAGQINAFGAVLAAGGGDIDGLSIASVRVGKGVTTATLVVRNFSESPANVTFNVGGSDRDAVSLDRSSATIPGKGKVSLTATIARADGAADTGSASIRATAGSRTAEGRLDWTADAGAVVQEVRVMPIRLEDDSFSPVVERLYTTTRLRNFDYSLFNLDAGTYLVIAVLDGNNDGDFDDSEDAIGLLTRPAEEGEVCQGGQCNRFTVAAGDVLEGQDLLLIPGFKGGDDVGGNGDGAVGDAATGSTARRASTAGTAPPTVSTSPRIVRRAAPASTSAAAARSASTTATATPTAPAAAMCATSSMASARASPAERAAAGDDGDDGAGHRAGDVAIGRGDGAGLSAR
jgi:hypothetical protein